MPLGRKIAPRLLKNGPIPFRAFMTLALYDSTHGYYRGDPFGKHGDFYTASQLQPVFGAYVKALASRFMPAFERFIDIGAGRAELSSSFDEGVYQAVEFGQPLPQTNRTVLFSNELIDAMPVDIEADGVLLRVACDDEKFSWHPHPPRGDVRELRDVRPHLEEAYRSIREGIYILIDYGYRAHEKQRFPLGSLMSYRKHVALDDVLSDAGNRDITAHVDWDRLIETAASVGWSVLSVSSLRSSILSLGEDALGGLNSLGQMQLKTLLFSMGESFDVLVLKR